MTIGLSEDGAAYVIRIPRRALEEGLGELGGAPDLETVELTPRQREVLALVCRQLGNKEIAARLNLSVRTVKFHVWCLFRLYEVSARRDLINRCYLKAEAK